MTTDEELVRRIRRADGRAFDELYRRYSRRLFTYIRRTVRERDLAEDLFQDVFLSVLRDRGFVPEEGNFAGWLFTVARNRCLTQVRDDRRRAEKLQGLEAEGAATGEERPPSQETVVGRAEELALVQRALAALPSSHHEVLLLKQLGQLTCREIAALQGVPEGTVKSRLHFAIRSLKESLAQGESA